MKNIIITIWILGISFLITTSLIASIQSKVTVKVVDEENIPINQADVEIIFSKARSKPLGKGWGNIVDYHKIKGQTNTDGIFAASYTTNMNIPVLVSKSGFYDSSGGISFNESGQADKEIVRLVLKRKRNPVSMYAKRTDAMKIPAFDQHIGYDLDVGDWVAPYGKGKANDFIFVFKSKVNAWNDYECSFVLTFTNEKDGIQEYHPDKENRSAYKWPFEAPTNNYKNMLSKFILNVPGKTVKTNFKKSDEIRYIFRVRTTTDKEGKIVSANYGKIKGEISISRNGYVDFSNYYFNPHGNRSLEFDTDKNLFIPEGAKKYKSKYNNFIKSDL